MTRTAIQVMFIGATAAVLLHRGGAVVRTQRGSDDDGERRVRNAVLARAVEIEAGRVGRLKHEQPVSSGVMYAVRAATWEMERPGPADTGADAFDPSAAASGSNAEPPAFGRTQGCSNIFERDDVRNIRVNQDCSLRRQAEEAIAINPTAPHNLIAGITTAESGSTTAHTRGRSIAAGRGATRCHRSGSTC